MTAAMENRPPGKITAFLAGLQGGMVGILCMLAWLGVSASWLRRSFWTSENLVAGAFYGDAAVQRGFVAGSVSGAALYILVYTALGGLFAAAVPRAGAADTRSVAEPGIQHGMVLSFVPRTLPEPSAAGLPASCGTSHGARPPGVRHVSFALPKLRTGIKSRPDSRGATALPTPVPVRSSCQPDRASQCESCGFVRRAPVRVWSLRRSARPSIWIAAWC